MISRRGVHHCDTVTGLDLVVFSDSDIVTPQDLVVFRDSDTVTGLDFAIFASSLDFVIFGNNDIATTKKLDLEYFRGVWIKLTHPK